MSMIVPPSEIGSVDQLMAYVFHGYGNVFASLEASDPTTEDFRRQLEHTIRLYAELREGGLDESELAQLEAEMDGVENAHIDALTFHYEGHDPGWFDGASRQASTENPQPSSGQPSTHDTQSADCDPVVSDPDQATYTRNPTHAEMEGGATLNLHHKGETVRCVQACLLDGGFYGPCATEDEKDTYFGEKTEAAVRAYQKDRGDEPTGVLTSEQYISLVGESRPRKPEEEEEDGAAEVQGNSEFPVSLGFKFREGDVYAGSYSGTNIRDANGNLLDEDASGQGIGIDVGRVDVSLDGELGDPADLGVQADVGGGATARAGVEYRATDEAVMGRVGGHVGVEAERGIAFGLRYFGGGFRANGGFGAAAEIEGAAAHKDGRMSASLAGRLGWILTAGGGVSLWVDPGKMADDAQAAYDVASDYFNGLEWDQRNAG